MLKRARSVTESPIANSSKRHAAWPECDGPSTGDLVSEHGWHTATKASKGCPQRPFAASIRNGPRNRLIRTKRRCKLGSLNLRRDDTKQAHRSFPQLRVTIDFRQQTEYVPSLALRKSHEPPRTCRSAHRVVTSWPCAHLNYLTPVTT